MLCDVGSIIEQMKVLSRTRGANVEALAEAHVAEVDRLKKEHAAEVERMKQQHETEVRGLKEEHSVEFSIPCASICTDEVVERGGDAATCESFVGIAKGPHLLREMYRRCRRRIMLFAGSTRSSCAESSDR